MAAGILFVAVWAWGLWLLYRPAAGLTWQFDDWANLKDLAQVSTREGLLNFVFGGMAGPTGRPLSLLAFVPNYADWNTNPWGFVQGNLLLHALNAWLAFLLFCRLSTVGQKTNGGGSMSAVVVLGGLAATLWATMAIHATSVLMPVQRMTQVSGFFTLLTLWVYLVLRQKWSANQGMLPLLSLSLVVGAGTVLATLGKENGVLTVSLVAVIETCWLRHRLFAPTWPRLWRLWVASAWLVVPLLLVAWYLIRGWDGLMQSYRYYRPFGLGERLATEPIILWEYLRQIVVPRAALLGPFHDGHPIYNWKMWQPWFAVVSWLCLMAGVWAWARKRGELARSVWLALMFFLVAHQVESTFIPLELYFEHRNYLATLGIAFAAAMAARQMWQRAPSLGGRAVTGGVALLLVGWQALATYQVSSAFGRPWLGAELWHKYHPNSLRATQTLAWQLGLQGFASNALKEMDEFAQNHPSEVAMRVQALTQSCVLFPQDVAEHRRRLDDLRGAAARLQYASGLVTGLRDLGELVRQDKCEGLELSGYQEFLLTALSNDAVVHSPRVRHHIHFELSLTAEKIGNADASIRYAEEAFYDFPSLGSGQRAALLMFQNGKLDEAIAWTQVARGYAPSGLQKWAWNEYFGSMKKAFEDIRVLLESEHESE